MIIANFTNGYSTATAPGLYQWDYGQILEIHGLSLPPAVEVHFAIAQSADDAKIRIGTTIDKVTRVAIPEFIVEQSRDAVAYIYISDTESGKTVKKINMPITARQKPEAFDAPEDAQLFREAIEAVNASADRAEEAEKSSEAWAHGHEKYPDRDEDNAKYYADQAHGDATKASQDRASVERTSDDVNNMAMRVNADKEESEQYKSQAAQSAASALVSENNAKSSENAAKEAMERAQIAEGQAELYAGQSEKSAGASEAAKDLVMQMGQEVAENKEYMNKKIDDFDVLHKQAIEDINNAGSGQIESINAAGQNAIENIGTGIDPTFTQEGKAADAKATGLRIDSLKDDLGNITGNSTITFSDPALKQYINTNGDTVDWSTPSVASGDYYKWAVIACSQGDKFTINGLGGVGGRLWAFADSSKNIIERSNTNTEGINLLITAPESAAWLIINDKNNKTSYYGEFVTNRIGELSDRIDYVTPQMFGAVGDNNTDDTDALQSAIDTGLPVLIPRGSTIRVDGDIVIGNSTTIFGRGRDAIISVRGSITTDTNRFHTLELFGFTLECRKITGSALSIIKENYSNAISSMSIHDMWFYNVNNLSTSLDNTIITIKGIRESNITNCLFYGITSSYGKGIVCQADSTHLTMNINISSCNFYDLHTCIDLDNTLESYIYLAGIRMCNNMFISATYAIKAKYVDTLYIADSMVDFAQRPIDIDSCGVVKIHHNYIQSLGAMCIRYHNSKDTECRFSEIVNNFLWTTSEDKLTDGVIVSSDNYNAKITHITISGNKGYALRTMFDLSNCQNGIVNDNMCVNSTSFVDGHSNSTNNMATLMYFNNNRIDTSVTNAFYRVDASCMLKNGNVFGVRLSTNGSKYVGNGDGTTKVFKISHLLFNTPQYAIAISGSSNYYVKSITQDTNYLYVELNEAPAVGSSNVVINWFAGIQ